MVASSFRQQLIARIVGSETESTRVSAHLEALAAGHPRGEASVWPRLGLALHYSAPEPSVSLYIAEGSGAGRSSAALSDRCRMGPPVCEGPLWPDTGGLLRQEAMDISAVSDWLRGVAAADWAASTASSWAESTPFAVPSAAPESSTLYLLTSPVRRGPGGFALWSDDGAGQWDFRPVGLRLSLRGLLADPAGAVEFLLLPKSGTRRPLAEVGPMALFHGALPPELARARRQSRLMRVSQLVSAAARRAKHDWLRMPGALMEVDGLVWERGPEWVVVLRDRLVRAPGR